MPRQAKKPKDFGEITLAIALLGGIIAVLLKITDFSNNQSLAFDPNLKVLVYGLIAFLLLELLIIFSFFIFKGIAAYADNTRKDIFEKIAEELFKISFIIAFSCFIGSILVILLKLFYLPPLGYGYILIVLIIVAITGAIFSTEIKNLTKLINKIKNSPIYLKIFIYLMTPIIIIFLILLATGILILVQQYLLTGSYTIEQSSPSIDNPDMLTFTMKEKGIRYDFTEVMLFKLNPSYPSISSDLRGINLDYNKTYRDNITPKPSCYLWVKQLNTVWYLNIINISNLSSGTYLLHAEVHAEVKNNLTNISVIGILADPADTFNSFADRIGVSKRTAEKLFYIPPEIAKANYTSNRSL